MLNFTDVAFANSSITARPVPGSDFKFAKIMTLPFFGAGLVELPPSGTKRAKNARKMQMVFFVHQGKVMVEVGAATWGGINQFAISKGGVFVVPRGEWLLFSLSTPCALLLELWSTCISSLQRTLLTQFVSL